MWLYIYNNNYNNNNFIFHTLKFTNIYNYYSNMDKYYNNYQTRYKKRQVSMQLIQLAKKMYQGRDKSHGISHVTKVRKNALIIFT